VYQIDPGAQSLTRFFNLNEFSFKVIASDTVAKKVLERKMAEITFPRAKITFKTTASLEPYQIIEIDSDLFQLTGTFRVTSLVRKGVDLYEVEAIELVEAEPMDLSDIPSVGPGVVTQDFTSDWITWGFIENPIMGLVFWCKTDSNNPFLSGFQLIVSYDTYDLVNTTVEVCNLGTLTNDLPVTYKVDRDVEFHVDSNIPFSLLGASDSGWFSGTYLLLINDEIISIRDVSTDSTGYIFKGVIRGFYKTDNVEHSSGADVYYLNLNSSVTENEGTFSSLIGQTLDFDITPIHHFGKGDIYDSSHSDTDTHVYKGNPYRPLPVWNVQVNNQGNEPVFIFHLNKNQKIRM